MSNYFKTFIIFLFIFFLMNKIVAAEWINLGTYACGSANNGCFNHEYVNGTPLKKLCYSSDQNNMNWEVTEFRWKPNAPTNIDGDFVDYYSPYFNTHFPFLLLTWDRNDATATSYNVYWSSKPNISTTNYEGFVNVSQNSFYVFLNNINANLYYIVTAKNKYYTSNPSVAAGGPVQQDPWWDQP